MTPEEEKVVDTTKVGVNNNFGAPIAKSADRLEREREVSKEPVRPDRIINIPKRGRYLSQNGQVTKLTGSDYISDSEEKMYQQDAITEMHLQQAKVEQTRARLAGRPITLDEAAQRVRIQDVDMRVNPGTGAAVQPGDTYSKRPLSPEEIEEQAAERFPILAMQAKISGLSREEQAAAVSLPLAIDVVRRISQTRNPSRQQQIISTMGPDMQALVMDVYTAWQAEAEKNVEASADQRGDNVITDAIGFIWDYGAGPILEGLFKVTEAGVRGIATAAVLGNSAIERQGMDPIEAWEATQPGVYNEEMVDYAKKRYGVETVDVILEALEVQNSENPDEGIAKIWDRYATEGDMERLSILEQAMSLSSYDKNTMDAITYLASSDLGNLGNRFSWSFLTMRGIDPNTPEGSEAAQSPLFTGTRDAVNVISLFAADPVSRGAAIAKIYKIQKYGLARMSPEQIDKTFTTGGVKNFFDTFGTSLAKADSLTDKTQSAQMINSLRSQYKNWLTPDAIEAMRKAKVFSADDAANFYKDARNLELMVKGQRAKRADQVTIPHMVKASAFVKRSSLVARGLTYDRNSAKKIDEIFGEGVSSMLPEEAIPVIIDRLASPSGDKFVGRMLSDFVYANGTVKRTFLGNIIGTLTPSGAKKYQTLSYGAGRYGFKRKGGARERIERLARTQAHVPDMSGGLNIATGKDAYKIRDLMLYGGMPKYWADYSAELWKTMNTGERKQFASGIGRSVGYSLGVDIVDPVTGAKLIDNIVSGLRPGELYSPNFVDMPLITGAIKRQALDSGESIDDIERAVAIKAFDAPMYNPSMLPDGTSAALYEYQMTDVIGFPNMAALDQMSLRQSYLTALLGDNKTMTTITDYWTLGTIGGPRFFLRNGLEDAGLYALTGGSWKDFRYGQLYSRAKREATQRVSANADDLRGQKLGLVVTSTRYLGDVLPKALNTIILPHIDEAERVAAKTMAANGDRSGLVSLINKAFMRQKLIFINRPKNPETIRYLDEAAEEGGFFPTMDEASETTEDLASGSMIGMSGSSVNRAILNGEIRDVRGVILPYKNLDVRPDNPESIRAWLSNINAVVYGDGKGGQKTLSILKSYHAAKTSGNANTIERVTKEYADWLEENATDAMKASAIYATEGAGSMARRKLDDALRVFTSKNGEFNDELLDSIKQVKTAKDGTQYDSFALYDNVDGQLVPRITEETLLNMNMKPLSVLGVENAMIPTTDKLPLTTRAWSAMGRSLARLTREPIFIANYLDARKLYAPIEKKMAEEYGEAYAKKWAVRNGYDRAFDLTMSYVDDPNVRSQMAWGVRNVARFYRAQEDFFRRMMRTGRNNPMAIQRLNLAWHALDETGFIHEDEMGDKYFVWPGNKVTINAINAITSKLGFNVLEGAGLADFSSKVTMFTPSADPSGLAFTLAGPYAAVTYPALMAMFPALEEVQSEVMGEYSVGRSAWDMAFPTMAKSLWDAGTVLAGRSTTAESETAFADSARAAVQIYAASGRFDENKIMSATDISKMKDELAVVGNDIAFYKAMTRPVSAAVMQLNPQTVTDFAKNMGISGMRKLFIELLKVNDGDFELAMSKWIKGNPGLSIFTVSENSNPDSFGSFDATMETQKFIEENEELFKISQVGSAFFAPQEGVQSLNAWKYLAAMGAKTSKSVDEYFNQMVTSEGYARYRNLQSQYYDLVEQGDETADDKWSNAKKKLFLTYPMLESRIRGGNLSDRSIPNPADARSEIEDIRTAVNWMDENGKLDERGVNARSVIKLYDQAKSQMQSLNPEDPAYDKNVSRIRGLWKNAYAKAINLYPQGDVQWRLLLNAVTDALDTRIN